MPAEDGPTPGEMWRRMDAITSEMRAGFGSLNERLDKMPTSELLIAYLSSRDQRLDHIEQRLTETHKETTEDVAKVDARVDGIARDLIAQRRWLVGVAVSSLGVVIALVTLLRSVIA